jgi:hypothetical protein
VILILVPGVWLVTLIVGQAQDVIGSLVQNPVLDRLQTLRILRDRPELVKLGQIEIGGRAAAPLRRSAPR